MLKSLGIDAIALKDVYPGSTEDVKLLTDMKDGRYDVFISNNTEQRKIPQERHALKESGVTSLYFNPFWGKMVFWDQATWLVKHWPKIDGYCRGTAKGTCADLQQNGEVDPVIRTTGNHFLDGLHRAQGRGI